MPAILGIGPEDLTDGSGFRIRFTQHRSIGTRVGDLTFNRSDLPGPLRSPNTALADIEAFIDQWLQDRLSVVIAVPDDPDFGQRAWEMTAKSHVRNANPLLVDVELT